MPQVKQQVLQMTSVDFLTQLPHELTLRLINFLDVKTQFTLLIVSRTWRQFSHQNLFWKAVYTNLSIDLDTREPDTEEAYQCNKHSILKVRRPGLNFALNEVDEVGRLEEMNDCG